MTSGPYDPNGQFAWVNKVIADSQDPSSNLSNEQREALVALVDAASQAASGGWLEAARERAKKVFGLK